MFDLIKKGLKIYGVLSLIGLAFVGVWAYIGMYVRIARSGFDFETIANETSRFYLFTD